MCGKQALEQAKTTTAVAGRLADGQTCFDSSRYAASTLYCSANTPSPGKGLVRRWHEKKDVHGRAGDRIGVGWIG